jgi:endonuclease/exonuclease/phosphatase (EEP) superfamily protein YafD
MRFLTFNLWHGLSPSNLVAFEALEPNERRRLREDLQVDVLRSAAADFSFFQEVNPIVTRAPALAKALASVAIYQPDLVGLKLFGLGFPFNLNSGLLMLAKEAWGLKKVDAVSLSRPGGASLVHTWASWQLKEERFALYGESLIPKLGRVLLVNTHLHHGLELTADFLEHIEQLGSELELTASTMSDLKDRLERGNQRRSQEMATLLRVLEKHEKRYEAVVLAGDFNASPASELSQMLRDLGFRDAWAEANPDDPGYSFDHTKNEANHLLQARFPLTLVVEDLTFSTQVKDSLLRLARAQENRPRRIDYLWFRSRDNALRVRRAELIGHPNHEGLAPSDHFGVLADLELG